MNDNRAPAPSPKAIADFKRVCDSMGLELRDRQKTGPQLTRRRCSLDPKFWEVLYGDVSIGSYGPFERKPNEHFWKWATGFYPGCEPPDMKFGLVDTEEEARAALLAEWDRLRPTLTEDQFKAWRSHARTHVWIRKMRAAGCNLPTMNPDGKSVCFCGEPIDAETDWMHIRDAHPKVR